MFVSMNFMVLNTTFILFYYGLLHYITLVLYKLLGY